MDLTRVSAEALIEELRRRLFSRGDQGAPASPTATTSSTGGIRRGVERRDALQRATTGEEA